MPDQLDALLDQLIDDNFPSVDDIAFGASSRRIDLPKVAQYRTFRPGLVGRFADGFRASDSLTETLVAKAITSPDQYRQIKSALDARANQYEPRNVIESGASWLGGAVKQMADPIGILAAALTKTSTQAALAGGAYEAGNSVMQNVAKGEDVDVQDAVTSGAAGMVGAGTADAAFARISPSASSSFWGGVVPELSGRVVGTGTLGELAEEPAGAAIDAYAALPREEYQQQGRRQRRLDKNGNPTE